MINLPSSVAICAMSRTGQREDLSGYEYVIGINNTHAELPHVKPDLIVAMDDLQRDVKTDPDYVDAIVNHGCPVLSTRKFRKWPNVQPYPLEKVATWLERKTDWPAYRLLDNSICYATALCLSQLVGRVGLFGVDLTAPYNDEELECAMLRWKQKGYGHAPDWFAHYDREVLVQRRPRECGWSSLHTLIGFGAALGVKFEWEPNSTIMDTDRAKFYYGYQRIPR